MGRLRTRSKYLIVRLLIAAGLTAAVVLTLRMYFARNAEREMSVAIQRCAAQAQAFISLEDDLNRKETEASGPVSKGGQSAEKISKLFDCEFELMVGGKLLPSSLPRTAQGILERQASAASDGAVWTMNFGVEKYQVSTVPLAGRAERLVVLKSWAEVHDRQARLTRLMIVLAIVASIVGFPLVLRVSDTFGRPLNNLVGAVHALEKGDYEYPVATQSGDELEEVTLAFEHMRASLQESQKRVIQSERLATIGQMASSISHDLRHSLTAIIANAEFLLDDKLKAEPRVTLYQEIRAAVEQMNDIIESLLEFSRGRETPRLVAVNLGDVVDRAVRRVKARTEFQRIEFRVEGAETLECEIDPVKIERALVNLLLNASEAVTANSGKVGVQWEKRGGALRMEVSDNGPGVEEEVRSKLFHPFASYGKATGTGLGLAIVQKICEDHGGSAKLESTRPGLTVFSMTLPQKAC